MNVLIGSASLLTAIICYCRRKPQKERFAVLGVTALMGLFTMCVPIGGWLGLILMIALNLVTCICCAVSMRTDRLISANRKHRLECNVLRKEMELYQ
jgi:hypothetical protein